MKKIIFGSSLIASGIILYGLTIVAASVYVSSLEGWDRSHGRVGTALLEMGRLPIIVSIICLLTGLLIAYKELKN